MTTLPCINLEKIIRSLSICLVLKGGIQCTCLGGSFIKCGLLGMIHVTCGPLEGVFSCLYRTLPNESYSWRD
jgi:hypothetical protein